MGSEAQILATRVSVAMCTYNGGEFLPAQLDSLIGQTQRPNEIVIVDDASTDETPTMLERFAFTAPVPVIIMRNERNIGFVKNFEAALAIASGEILLPCDQDDVWQPTKIQRLVTVLNSTPEAMLAHSDARLVDAAVRPMGLTLFEALRLTRRERRLVDAGQPFRAQLRRNLVTGATSAFRRLVFEHARPFPPTLVHDDWLATVAALLGRIIRVEEPLNDYRQHVRNELGMPVRTLAGHIGARLPRRELDRCHVARLDLISELIRRLAEQPAAISHGTSEQALGLIEKHRRHLRVRAHLPSQRIARLPAVVVEAASGRYFECSNGWLSIGRDLIEPGER